MNNKHSNADEVLDLANIALSKGERWVAYNQSLYFLDRENVHFLVKKPTPRNSPWITSVIGITF